MKKIILISLLLAGNLVYSQHSPDMNQFRYGIILGDPTKILLAAGEDYINYSYRIGAGGWFDGSYGFQGELFYSVYKRNSFEQNLGLITGYAYGDKLYERTVYNYYFHWKLDDPEMKSSLYIGPSYKINWNHFYINSSVAIGSENFKYPRLLLQIGYYF